MEKKSIDKLTTQLCENLPGDLTIYQRDGFCVKKGNVTCNYYKNNKSDVAICIKKTYTGKPLYMNYAF